MTLPLESRQQRFTLSKSTTSLQGVNMEAVVEIVEVHELSLAELAQVAGGMGEAVLL